MKLFKEGKKEEMKKLKKVSVIMMAVFMLLLAFFSTVFAQESASKGNMNFDVMFVIDASGSMLKSDPDNLRMVAGRLFTDLVALDTSRAGYVQFTNGILSSAGLTDLSTEKNKNAFRNTLAGLAEAPKDLDDTDISLGLAEAIRLLKEGNAFEKDRKPVIILLSDGNTDLPHGPRTVEESEAQLVSVLDEAVALDLPIYSIGLNYGDQREIEKMQQNLTNIAEKTNGKFYNVETAQDFSEYMTEIFDDLSDGGMQKLNPEHKDDRFTAPFVIDNSSVLSAQIVILTEKGVSDPKLYRPADNGGKEEVPLNPANNVYVTTDVDENHSSYMVLKVMYPKQGTWEVSVAGKAEDAIEIKLLTTYDISFLLDSVTAKAGETVEITGSLHRAEEQIVDKDLLEGSQAYCTITDSQGNKVEENMKMTYDPATSTYSYQTSLGKSGNYYVNAHLVGKDGSFEKDSTQSKITVERIPIEVTGSASGSMWCSPIKTKAQFDLAPVVSCESVNELFCTMKDAENIAVADYDPATGVVTLVPLKTGEETMTLILSDNYGQSAELQVFVKVKPSWVIIVVILVVLLLLAFIILLVIRATRPKLTETITVELGMPPHLRNQTPGATNLAMNGKKPEVNLAELIHSDPLAKSTLMQPIMQAGMDPLVGKIKLVASGKGKTSVKLMPKVQGKVRIDNQDVNTAKGCTASLIPNRKLEIRYSLDGRTTSTLTLSLASGGGWQPAPTPFSPNMDGPFGGGDNRSPFGNDNGTGTGFGNPFGSQSGSFEDSFGSQSSSFEDSFGSQNGSFEDSFGSQSSGFGDSFTSPNHSFENPEFGNGFGTQAADNDGFGAASGGNDSFGTPTGGNDFGNGYNEEPTHGSQNNSFDFGGGSDTSYDKFF